MTKSYWDVRLSRPSATFAAWVDEDGRLARFNLSAKGAAKVDPALAEAERQGSVRRAPPGR